MITIEVVGNYEAFMSLESGWNKLVEKSGAGIPFLTFQWLNCWWQSYGAGNQMLIVIAKDGGEIVGIAPLMITKVRRWGIALRAVTFMANYHTNRMDFIITGDKNVVISAMLDHIKKNYKGIDAYLLDFLVDGSESDAAVTGILAGKNLRGAKANSIISPFIKINGNWENYVSSLSKKWKRKISDTGKRFARLENGIVKYTDSEIDKAFGDLLAVSKTTWQYDNGTAIASTKQDTAMYYSLAKAMSEKNCLRLWILKINELPVAFMYAIEYANKLFALKIGFNKEYAQESPGVFLSAHVIRECFNNKLDEFDWLGENNDYKMKWTPLCRQHVQHRIYNNTLLGNAAYVTENMVRAGKEQLARWRPAPAGEVSHA